MRRSALVLLFLLAAAPAEAAPTRYSLAGSCRQINGVPTRLQATALGRYLLYRPDGTFVAARPDGSVGVDAAPSAAADWTARRSGSGFRFTAQGATITGPVPKATGCAVYPEAELDATGTPSKGATPYGTVGGLVDGHMHWMTYEYLGGNFHCGKPWDAFGIPYALPDCAAIEGPAGAAAPFQNFLNYSSPVYPHDTRGFPQLTEWKPTNLTYEGTYWRWIQRAYLGGLRLMVMSVNENRVLCELQANHRTDCDEMETVRRGLDDIRELQRYVDAQAGGPGKGFFQIVTTPYAARRVINAGKLAVVLEIELSEPFGCSGWDAPTCDRAQVDAGLADLYKRGVRSALLLNKFDNPLTGVRFDGGPVGTIINGGNLVSAGSFWSAQTCSGPLHDNTIATASPVQTGAVGGLLGSLGVQAPPVPVYPPAPHCNTRGLTALGAHTVEQMMDRHMIVNPDHMSQAGVDATLSLLEARHYSGVISPHGWMDPGNWPRIWKLGGLAWPGHSDAAEYVKEWQQLRPQQTPYAFGWGYGADLGGLSVQPSATSGLTYPFKSIDGKVTFQRQKTGDRTFDYPSEGVAHYGLYADWFADLRRLGGQQLAKDLWDGAEAYLEMWERADGIAAASCAPGRRLPLGASWTTLLRRAGQPRQRSHAWAWCVQGGGADVAVLGPGGHAALTGSTAPGRSVGGVAVGDRMAGSGVVVRGRRAYAVRGGRVVAVGEATRSLSQAAIRSAMARVRSARAATVARRFVPNASASASLTGHTLAGTGTPSTDAALTLLCSLLST